MSRGATGADGLYSPRTQSGAPPLRWVASIWEFAVGALQPIHWILVLVVVLVVFGGRGKLSGIMGDAAKGIRAFKEGLKDENHEVAEEVPPSKPLPKTRAKSKTVS